jgi:hypothetical protein
MGILPHAIKYCSNSARAPEMKLRTCLHGPEAWIVQRQRKLLEEMLLTMTSQG